MHPAFRHGAAGRFAAYSAGAGEPIGEVENELVTMRRGSDDSSVVLEVAGFGLTLGRASDTETGKHREVKSYPRVCGVFCDGIELGFNTLVGLDYAGYPAGTEDLTPHGFLLYLSPDNPLPGRRRACGPGESGAASGLHGLCRGTYGQ